MRLRWSGGPDGWGGFAAEIAVVVIGVLIALGAQQLVEQYNDRERADRAISSLRAEVADIDFRASEIEIVAPCILAQLDSIQQRLVAGDRARLELFRQNLSGGDFVVRTPSRVWSNNVWESVSSTDVLRRTRPELDRRLAGFYSQVAHQREGNDRVRSGVQQLNALAILVPESETDRFRLITTIAQIRGELSLMHLRSGQLRDSLAAADMLLADDELSKRLAESGTIKFCREKGHALAALRMADAARADQ